MPRLSFCIIIPALITATTGKTMPIIHRDSKLRYIEPYYLYYRYSTLPIYGSVNYAVLCYTDRTYLYISMLQYCTTYMQQYIALSRAPYTIRKQRNIKSPSISWRSCKPAIACSAFACSACAACCAACSASPRIASAASSASLAAAAAPPP